MMDRHAFNRAVADGDEQGVKLQLHDLATLVASMVTRDPFARDDIAQATWIHLAENVLPKLDPAKGSSWSYCFGSAYRFAAAERGKLARHASGTTEPAADCPTIDRDAAADSLDRQVLTMLRANSELCPLVDALDDGAVYSKNGRPVMTRVARCLGKSPRQVRELMTQARSVALDEI